MDNSASRRPQAVHWGLRKIGALEAWQRSEGEGVKVAVVDSGADTEHPGLVDKVAARRDFTNESNPVSVPEGGDTTGHGTSVAAAVAAEWTGLTGSCPECKLLIAKIDSLGGYDPEAIADGIVWAVDEEAEVVNLSLASTGDSAEVEEAVEYAAEREVVVVAAAGNAGSGEITYPAAYPEVIAVGATDREDRRADFSVSGDWVDLSAPGVEIPSALVGGGSQPISATSIAAPQVSGVAALLAAMGLPADDIRDRLRSTAVDLGAPGKDPEYGWGRVDAGAAVGEYEC